MRTYNIIDTRFLRRKLRKNQTTAEKRVWSRLRKKQLYGLRFVRQHGIDRYIVDFYCPSKKLAIEIDGDTHAAEKNIQYDIERTNHLTALGIRVVLYPLWVQAGSVGIRYCSLIACFGTPLYPLLSTRGDCLRGTSMTFLIISSILAALVAFSSGLFVYLKNRKSPLNTAFFLMNICVGIWNTGELLIYLSPDNNTALWWDRCIYFAGIFIPPFFTRLIFSFLNVQNSPKYKKYFYYSCIVSIIFAACNFSPWFLKSVTIQPFSEQIGPLFYPFMLVMLAQLLYGLYALFFGYHTTQSPTKRNQLRYAIAGLSMGFVAIVFYFVTFLYPPFPKIHMLIEILYFCIFAYAIAKHRLMDITVVFKWSSIVGGVAICLTGIYIAGLVIAEFVLSHYMDLSPIALRIIVVAVIALTLTPFRSTIKKILLSIFLKREQETEDELDGLSRYLLMQLNFDEDSLLLVTELESIMRTQCVTVTVYDGKVRGFRSEISVNFEEQLKKFDIPNSAILAWLEEHQRTLVKSWFDSSKKYEQTIIAECEMLCAEIVVPMIFEEQAIGFIALGERKWRQYTYNVDEICLLEHFANEVVVALKNALEVSHIPKETIKTVKIHHFPNGWTAIDGVQDDDKKKDGDDDDDPVIA